MTYFEKYLQLKEEYKGFVNDDLLLQYLAIVQSMNIGKEHFDKYNKELKGWLDNIEKSMKEQKNGLKEETAEKSKSCQYCEDTDKLYDAVCYIPQDNGNAIDIFINYCPNCGRKLT